MLKWAETPTTEHRTSSQVITKSFHLAKLAQQNLLESPCALQSFQQKTGLADLYWEVSYHSPTDSPLTLTEQLTQTDGVVIFLHGCNGKHTTWENLPAELVAQHPRIVAFNLDIYGFGESPFLHEYPHLKHITMTSAMRSVEYWLELMGLWPLPQRDDKMFYLFVGHSMGGGMLFYKDEPNWRDEVYGCYLISPSMFYRDKIRRVFYQLIGLATLIPYVTPIKRLVAKIAIESVMNGASRPVKKEHRTYNTPFGTLAASLCGIGHSPKTSRADWSQFRIVMGNRDVVVSPRKMLKFVEELGFQPDQLRITLGDHYLFSCDDASPASHHQSRQFVLDDLVDFCKELALTASSYHN